MMISIRGTGRPITQWLSRDAIAFFNNADKVTDPPLRVHHVEVKCEDCGDEHPMSVNEAYLPMPKKTNARVGARSRCGYAPERYKKLLPCPICGSHFARITRVIRK